MKKTLSPILFLLSATTFFLFSCQKDSSDSMTTVELIADGPWKFSKATASGVDVSALVQPCIKDNLLNFFVGSPSNTGNLNEGPTKCNAADQQQVEFTWTYDASFQKIAITSVGGGTIPILPGGSNEFTLVSVDELQMVLSQTVTFSGTAQLVQVTLVH
ncbi:MAG: hypothetical protein MUE99_01160 [Chitinophagaceae bacterium]|jgi:hypothetical protein|nr:hypothetical protein [Chitinophagaceae bacterium]